MRSFNSPIAATTAAAASYFAMCVYTACFSSTTSLTSALVDQLLSACVSTDSAASPRKVGAGGNTRQRSFKFSIYFVCGSFLGPWAINGSTHNLAEVAEHYAVDIHYTYIYSTCVLYKYTHTKAGSRALRYDHILRLGAFASAQLCFSSRVKSGNICFL